MPNLSQARTARVLADMLAATTDLPVVPWRVIEGELTATIIHREAFDAWCTALDVTEVDGPYQKDGVTWMFARGYAGDGAVVVHLTYRDGD